MFTIQFEICINILKILIKFSGWLLNNYGISFNYGVMNTNIYFYDASIGINGYNGGAMDFISVTPGLGYPATASSYNPNNSIGGNSISTYLPNKKYSFFPADKYIYLIYPENNSCNLTELTLEWEAKENVTNYHLMVSTLSDFSTTIVNDSTLTTTTYQLENLDEFTTYFWQVRVLIDGEYKYISSTWRFATAGELVESPSLVTPINATILSNPNVQFNWNSVFTAYGYQIQVATDVNFDLIELDETLSSQSINNDFNYMSCYYYWRVRAINIISIGPWSSVWCFNWRTTSTTAPILYIL